MAAWLNKSKSPAAPAKMMGLKTPTPILKKMESKVETPTDAIATKKDQDTNEKKEKVAIARDVESDGEDFQVLKVKKAKVTGVKPKKAPISKKAAPKDLLKENANPQPMKSAEVEPITEKTITEEAGEKEKPKLKLTVGKAAAPKAKIGVKKKTSPKKKVAPKAAKLAAGNPLSKVLNGFPAEELSELLSVHQMLLTFGDHLKIKTVPHTLRSLAHAVTNADEGMAKLLAELVKCLLQQYNGNDETFFRLCSTVDAISSYECLRRLLTVDPQAARFSDTGMLQLLNKDAEEMSISERLSIVSLAANCILSTSLVHDHIDECHRDLAEVANELRTLQADRRKRVRADQAEAKAQAEAAKKEKEQSKDSKQAAALASLLAKQAGQKEEEEEEEQQVRRTRGSGPVKEQAPQELSREEIEREEAERENDLYTEQADIMAAMRWQTLGADRDGNPYYLYKASKDVCGMVLSVKRIFTNDLDKGPLDLDEVTETWEVFTTFSEVEKLIASLSEDLCGEVGLKKMLVQPFIKQAFEKTTAVLEQELPEPDKSYASMTLQSLAEELQKWTEHVKDVCETEMEPVVDVKHASELKAPLLAMEALLTKGKFSEEGAREDLMEVWWGAEQALWKMQCENATSRGQIAILLDWLISSMRDPHDTKCGKCRNGGDAKQLLLCDSCDAGYHTFCVGLDRVPKGSWFCQKCQRNEKKGAQVGDYDENLVFAHKAEENDTPFKLAAMFKVDVEDIIYLNKATIVGITAKARFTANTTLLIPKEGVKLAPRVRRASVSKEAPKASAGRTKRSGAKAHAPEAKRKKEAPAAAPVIGKNGRVRRAAATQASTRLVDKYYHSDESSDEGPEPERPRSVRIKSRSERMADRNKVAVVEDGEEEDEEDVDEEEEEAKETDNEAEAQEEMVPPVKRASRAAAKPQSKQKVDKDQDQDSESDSEDSEEEVAPAPRTKRTRSAATAATSKLTSKKAKKAKSDEDESDEDEDDVQGESEGEDNNEDDVDAESDCSSD